MKLIIRFFNYFSKYRNLFIFYTVLSLFVGLLELGGVALVYPFLYTILSAEKGLTAKSIILGILIISVFLLKNIIMIGYTYFQAKLIKYIEKDINIQFMQYFVSSSYKKTSLISFGEKMNILGFIISKSINDYILRIQNIAVNLFIFILLMSFIIYKFLIASAIVFICAIALYIIQRYCFTPLLSKIGAEIKNTSLEYSKKKNEILINLKTIKTAHKELYFFNQYKSAIRKYYKNLGDTHFYNSVPPYITEPTVIILLFILIAIVMYQNANSTHTLIASLGAIIAAVFRLTPTISRIQVNINGINSSKTVVAELLQTYEKLGVNKTVPIKEPEFAEFNNCLELKNISFEYNEHKPVLKNINLKIKKGEFIGIAGLSGAGKTTLADIIAGLLEIKDGEFLVDGKPYSNPLKIGYITQEYTTISGTIRENVAFGDDKIDDKRVIQALKDAQLLDFIEDNFPDGIYANPFVDSVGFSLGQKQRLAIARTLYLNPDIIIMDEATSSLDLKTEDDLCKVLINLKGDKTIIAIAHRLSTIKSADRIVFLKDGNIKYTAPFDELIKISTDFNELVKLASLNKN